MNPSDSRTVSGADADISRPAQRDVSAPTVVIWHSDAQVRAAQLSDTLDAAGRAALAPVIAAIGLFTFFWPSADWIYVGGLLLVTTLGSLGAYIAARLDVCRRPRPRAVGIGLPVVVAFAAVMGCAWGTMPVVLFSGASADQRLIVVAAAAVVLANVCWLAPVRFAGLCYLGPICAGSTLGFALGENPASYALAGAVPFYGWCLLSYCTKLSSARARHVVDRINIAAQNHTIHELLLDFDDNASDWLWRTDDAGRLSNITEGAALPLLASQVEGATFDAIFARLGASTATDGGRAVLEAMSARKPFRNQLIEIRGKEASCWWRLSGKPVYDGTGHFSGYRGVGSDMTGVRNSESQIARLANYDALTGFANRANFQTFAGRECAAAAVDGHCRALLSLDLDGFKSVNDSLGHEGGDELLRQVAERLKVTAPAGTFIARLGGDEFGLWLQPTTPAKSEVVAHALIEVIGVPFNIHGLQIDIGASVGMAFAPKHAIDPDDLLVKADLALYRAKAENKGQACVFAPAFETSLIDRRKLEGDLKLALVRGEFALHYQPLLDVAKGRIVGFESLIRWQSPDRGFVSPVEFIPAAESMGLIRQIGRWVLFEACRTAATWPHDVHVAVNVSPPHVRSPEFMQDVVMALKTSGLHPSRLEIEVTEGVFLDKSSAAVEALKTLRKRGIRIALDDFGTGYSSLNYLIDFPVDKIKIDQSFVRDFVDSHANQAIIDAILGLARKLSIRVTAEGVETKEQALALKRRRCDELQGYLLSRPRPASDVPHMIASVPSLFREAVPTYMDSPLAMALTARKHAV